MSGYDVSKKPDYKAEVNEELDRIESRLILLNDMLNQTTSAEFKKKIDSTIEELHGSGKTAQNRLMKFIEENDDEVRMVRLLELNDLINMVMNKYDDLKRGNEVQKNSIDRQSAIVEGSTAEPVGGAINLIDFDAFDSLPVSPPTQQQGMANGIMSGIQGLNFGNNYTQTFQQPNNFANQIGQSNFEQFGSSNQQYNNFGMVNQQSLQGNQYNNFQQPQGNAQVNLNNQSNPFGDLLSMTPNSSSQKQPQNSGFDLVAGSTMMSQPLTQQTKRFDFMGGTNPTNQQQKPQNIGFDLLGGGIAVSQPQKQQGADMMGGMAQRQNIGFDLIEGNNTTVQQQKPLNNGFDLMVGNNLMAQQQKPQNNGFDSMGGINIITQPQKQQITGLDMMGGNMVSNLKKQNPPMNKECK